MNEKILTIVSILLMGFLTACVQPTELEPTTGIGANSFSATFSDGTGLFTSENTDPFGDTIRIIIPYYYPVESSNLSDITQMKVIASLPNNVFITPALGSLGLIDLSKPTEISIHSSDGTVTSHFLIGKIKKSSDAQIKEFSLPGIQLNGFVIESQKIVGLVSGGVDMNNQSPNVVISPHATITPDPSIPQNFNGPVTYTVTAHDGTQIQYTVKTITPNKIAAGLRIGSGRLLWSKTLTEMGIASSDNFSTSIAISGNNLVVNTRNVANRYFNRFNGSYVGDMVMTGIDAVPFKNFHATSDEAGNILISNLATAANQKVYVYKWQSASDPAPVKFIEWINDIAGSNVGRKISVKGNLDQDALIFMGASNSNNTILRWKMTNGTLESQTPVKIVYTGTKKWSYMADAISEGTNPNDNLFVSGYPSDFAYVNTLSGNALAQVDLAASGYTVNHSIDHVVFNNSKYLAAVNINPFSWGTPSTALLYDVSIPAALGTLPSEANYSQILVYKSSPVPSPAGNGNSTGDVLMKVSDDGYKMVMYLLVTNGGVAAFEFDCIDVNNVN